MLTLLRRSGAMLVGASSDHPVSCKSKFCFSSGFVLLVCLFCLFCLSSDHPGSWKFCFSSGFVLCKILFSFQHLIWLTFKAFASDWREEKPLESWTRFSILNFKSVNVGFGSNCRLIASNLRQLFTDWVPRPARWYLSVWCFRDMCWLHWHQHFRSFVKFYPM